MQRAGDEPSGKEMAHRHTLRMERDQPPPGSDVLEFSERKKRDKTEAVR